jgi:hypothetical protein
MPACDYCEESFEDEEALLRHMGDVHAGELGTIDQRRVEDIAGGDDGGIDRGPLILGGVVLFAAAVVVYVIFFVGGGGGAGAPADLGQAGSTHEHGTIEMQVLGEEVDFSQDRYQQPREVPRFHFEAGNGDVWHKHATGVTLQWAMGTLPGIEVTAESVTYQGTTYEDSDPEYDVTVAVNGEPVDPSTYVLQGSSETPPTDGSDHVRIVVRSANQTG